MESSRALDGVRGLWPLTLCVVYFLNPKRSYELAYAVVFFASALFVLWKNPFRGQPRSALLLTTTYAAAATVLSVKFLYGHQYIDALWVGVFSAIGVGWWFWYRHDTLASSMRDTSLKTNHG
jgi:hypothetical protein